MIHEVATLRIQPGSEADFEAAVARAVPHFQQAPGALSLRLDRSVENPSEYTLTVGWESVEAHTEQFRNSEAYGNWRSLVQAYFAEAPQVKHVQHVLKGF